MIVAFDIDDTITRHPPFFAFLTRCLLEAGHEVIIITFREDRALVEHDLRQSGILYSQLVTATTDELLAHGPDRWKAAFCRRHGVEIIFEDMPEVLQHMDDDVVAFMPIDRGRHRLELLIQDAMDGLPH